jgi:polar amino acid transport system substrate-binding protein
MLTPRTSVRAAALAAAVLTTCLARPAAAVELPESVVKRGGIATAIIPNYPPLEFRDPATTELTGFDVELGQEIAKRLGTKIIWQETSFEQMLPSLATGRIDMVLSGMTDLASRQEASTFIDYMKTGPQFFVRGDRKAEFTEPTALCGKSVGASRRTSTPKDVAAWSDEHCVKAGKPPINFVGTEGSADARTQLKQGRVDAAAQGSETLPYIMAQEPGAFAPVGETFKVGYNGIATRKVDTALQAALADGLKQVMADGTYAGLLAKWNLRGQAIDKVMVNAGE